MAQLICLFMKINLFIQFSFAADDNAQFIMRNYISNLEDFQ